MTFFIMKKIWEETGNLHGAERKKAYAEKLVSYMLDNDGGAK